MSRYLIIGLVILGLISALGVAGRVIYNQGQAITNLETAVETEQKARESIQNNIKEQNEKVEKYNKKVSSISDSRENIREKAVNHSSRVTRIAAEKPRLYEKLVNKDFKKTQEKLRELMK